MISTTLFHCLDDTIGSSLVLDCLKRSVHPIYILSCSSLIPHRQKVTYEVCLKSNGTVHSARKTFITEKKALLSMMSQRLKVSKTKFQHSVTTTFFFACFSVKALSLRPF